MANIMYHIAYMKRKATVAHQESKRIKMDNSRGNYLAQSVFLSCKCLSKYKLK